MTYLTTAEVAELKGCTARYVRQLAQSGKLEHMEKDSAANNRTEYVFPLAALPEKLQIKYENKKRCELGLEPMPLPCKAVPKPDPRQITLQDLTGDQRRDVGFWCEIIKQWQAVRNAKGAELGKCKVDELFCAMIKLDNPKINISPDILYRKYKAYKDGNIDGLIDHRGGHNKGRTDIPQYMLDAFYSLYLHDNKLPVSRCYSLLQTWTREHYPEAAGNMPSERTFRRKAEALPYALVMFMREGDKMFSDKCLPYIERMYDDLHANDVWIADNHIFDFFTSGENGKPHRVYLTAFTDAKSGVMVGWNLTEN
ncbi:MAG: MerR family transcriptional regulator, partial [Oscillospiraceae bacterium]|nr:MerR family transcriptional regulator [Oscillospiraceae bacterium]